MWPPAADIRGGRPHLRLPPNPVRPSGAGAYRGTGVGRIDAVQHVERCGAPSRGSHERPEDVIALSSVPACWRWRSPWACFPPPPRPPPPLTARLPPSAHHVASAPGNSRWLSSAAPNGASPVRLTPSSYYTYSYDASQDGNTVIMGVKTNAAQTDEYDHTYGLVLVRRSAGAVTSTVLTNYWDSEPVVSADGSAVDVRWCDLEARGRRHDQRGDEVRAREGRRGSGTGDLSGRHERRRAVRHRLDAQPDPRRHAGGQSSQPWFGDKLHPRPAQQLHVRLDR